MLCIAIVLSVLVHAVILSVRFGATSSFDLKKNVPAIELVLVNPLPRKIVNTALTDGNGQAGIGAVGKGITGTAGTREKKTDISVNRKNEKIPSKSSGNNKAASVPERKTISASKEESGFQLPENQESRSVVFRQGRGNGGGNGAGTGMDAGGAGSGGRPVITANTRDVGYAMYYKALRKRVESLGLINFPQRNGTRLYGELTVRIPVYYDGSLFEKEGGPSIERSSGNPALDKAALNIVRRAAPFGPFPKSMRPGNGGADVWIIITRLKFTRDQGVQSQVRSTVH